MASLIHSVSPAERQLEKIDELDIALERQLASKEVDLIHYQRMKYALELRRTRAWRKLCREMNWSQHYNPEHDPIKDRPEPTESPPEPVAEPPPPDVIEEPANDPPNKRRLLHYAIFWVDLFLLVQLLFAVKWLFGLGKG